MNDNVPSDDSACPALFVAIPAVVGALLWLGILLNSI
jgi:hypothetical protein